MEKKILEYIRKFHMITEGCHLILGVSGGADSTALLLLLKSWQETGKSPAFTMEVLHVEHGIRGADSRADARFVEELCGRLKVPCRVISVDAPGYAAREGLGLEEAARLLRRQELTERARAAGGRIVLAHHRDDQAETVLFHMVRGSGIRGLKGIAPLCREEGLIWIRPLLCVSRGEIEGYLNGLGQDWRTDATNASEDYARNRIRLRILPELEQVNAQAGSHLARTAEELAEIEEYLLLQTSRCAPEAVRQDQGRYRISVAALLQQHPVIRRSLCMQVLEQAAGHSKDLERIHVEELLSLTEKQSGRRISLPYGLTAVREYGDILLYRDDGAPSSGPVGWNRPQENLLLHPEISEGGLEIPLEEGRLILQKCPFSGNLSEIPKKECTKWFDYDKIENGLFLRTRRDGDYLIIHPSGQKKSLNRYLIDSHVPAERRDQIPLLADGSTVLWVIGGRGTEACRVSEETVWILKAEFTGGKRNG